MNKNIGMEINESFHNNIFLRIQVHIYNTNGNAHKNNYLI